MKELRHYARKCCHYGGLYVCGSLYITSKSQIVWRPGSWLKYQDELTRQSFGLLENRIPLIRQMKRNRLKKFCAIILLLVFCQKVGGGLYLHNWLHHANVCKEISRSSGERVTGFNCSCIDDFSVPFAESAEFLTRKIYPEPAEFISSYKFLIPVSSPSLQLQRGPPFCS